MKKKTAHTIKCKKRVGLWVGDGGDYGCKLIRRTKPQMGDAKGWGGGGLATDNGNAHKIYLHAFVRTEKSENLKINSLRKISKAIYI